MTQSAKPLAVDPAHVLVIDDDRENNWVLQQMLELAGYTATAAETGTEGLASVQHEKPDLILLDVMLPDLSGYAICEQLKGNEQTRQIPVIFISSLQETLDKIRGFAAGGVDYITKPFEAGEVLARVRTHLHLFRLQLQEQRRVDLLQTLREVGLELTSTLDLSQVLIDLVKQAARLVGSRMGGLYLLRPDNQTLEMVVSHYGSADFRGVTLALGEGLCGQIALKGEPIAVSHYSSWEYKAAAFEGYAFQRVLGVPLHWRERVIGVLNLADENRDDPFTEEQTWLASLFAEQAAVAIQNARLVARLNRKNQQLREISEQLRLMATTDKLTGAFNRRKFTAIVHHEMQRSQRYQQPLSLILFDIDHFKQVNDRLGHQVGDLVLAELAGLVRQSIRLSDSLTRWGGEEFIVLSPGIGLDQAVGLAEKLREKVAEHSFGHANEGTGDALLPPGSVTISLGVAQFRLDETSDQLINRADEALYRAKREGRNRVEVEGS